MKPVLVPTSDVNSEHGILVAWFVENGAEVSSGELLAEVETSKAVLELVAPESGTLLRLADQGQEVPLTEPVALLFADAAELAAHRQKVAGEERARAAAAGGAEVRATVKAVARAAELGVDLSTLDSTRLLTVKDVEAAAAALAPVDESELPEPLTAPPGVARIVLIGGGLGATQVIDILTGWPEQAAVAIVDDDPAKWGTKICGVPVIGGSQRLMPLFKDGVYDAVIVAIGTSVAARRRFRELCEQAGIPLANAIDRTAKIATDVVLGQGNVICAFCHLGTGVRMGDNNFISAYNSFDHHSEVGSDIATGPGCMTSGIVKLRDRVRLGTGIFIEPGVELGEAVQVASGAVIIRSVPPEHSVKTKIVTTTVVPSMRSAQGTRTAAGPTTSAPG